MTSANLIALWYAIVAGSEGNCSSSTDRTHVCLHTGSVMAVPSVGIQITTTHACGYTRSQFYPWRIVTNVIINETFTMVKYTLSLEVYLYKWVRFIKF